MKFIFPILVMISIHAWSDVRYDNLSVQEQILVEAQNTNHNLIKLTQAISVLTDMQDQIKHLLSKLEFLLQDIHACTVPQIIDNEGKERQWHHTSPIP